MKKRGLGKGLEALLGEQCSQAITPSHSRLIDIDTLSPNRFQPRRQFDAKTIDALANSIRQHGIIQPLAVRAIASTDTHEQFEIIAGERRLRAAKQAGFTEVPVIIHDIDDADSAAFALIENLQREDLNVIDKAQGIANLIAQLNLTHEACARLLGQSRSAVSNTLRLLELSEVVQTAVKDKRIDMGHARALLTLDKAEQHSLLAKIILNSLSVRETERLVSTFQQQQPQALVTVDKAIRKQLRKQSDELSKHLNTAVKIMQNAQGSGKITLNFNDEKTRKQLIKKLKA